MSRIVLRDYLGRIERLLDNNRLAEAGAHCHFILQQYPRCLDAYRLLGRALLEQHLIDDSIDVFRRILSAEPEDLIAHAGIGLAFREQGDLRRAAWHLDRAIELDPYNRVVKQERMGLSASGDDSIPEQNGLSRVGLARLYFRSGLIDKTIRELRFLLQQYPERIDLQMLMAEALYWEGWRVDSVKVCMEILERLPYCAKANAILADVWLSTERTSEARKYLERVYSLYPITRGECDDQSVVGRALLGYGAVTNEPVLVDELEEYGITPQTVPEQLGQATEAELTVGDGDVVPEWLLELDTYEEGETVPGTAAPVPEKIAEDEPLFDWLHDIAEQEGDFFAVEDVESALADYESKDDDVVEESEGELTEPDSDEIQIIDSSPHERDSDLKLYDNELDEADIASTVVTEHWEEVIEEMNPSNAAPDWLYTAVGFTDELKELDNYRLPDWLQEAIDDEEATDQGDEPAKSGEEVNVTKGVGSLLDDPGHTKWEGEYTPDIEGIVEPIRGTIDEQQDDIPDWLREDGEILEELPGQWLDSIDMDTVENEPGSDETVTWLNELDEISDINPESGDSGFPDFDEKSARPESDEHDNADSQPNSPSNT